MEQKIEVVNSPDPKEEGCVYHFTCTYTRDEPWVGLCTLTFQEPPTVMGPAFVTLRLRDVTRDSDGVCVASAATITGNYFYVRIVDRALMLSPQ